MDEAATISDVTKMWENGGATWETWMNNKYIKGQALEEVLVKQNDLASWKDVLRRRTKIESCVGLGRGILVQWRGLGEKPIYRNIFASIRRSRG